jgi:hypothetical protein
MGKGFLKPKSAENRRISRNIPQRDVKKFLYSVKVGLKNLILRP